MEINSPVILNPSFHLSEEHGAGGHYSFIISMNITTKPYPLHVVFKEHDQFVVIMNFETTIKQACG